MSNRVHGIMLLVGAGPVTSTAQPELSSAQPEAGLEACPEPSRRACAELSRSGLALPNQASDPEKGAASSAPTIQIPQ